MDSERSSSDFLIIDKINSCAPLPTLGTLNKSLESLIESDNSIMSQISEMIGRDPVVTAKLLHLANSIFFGFSESQPIKSIEEASFYVGLKQLSHIVASTKIIEDCSELKYLEGKLNWEAFWLHSIACAILTREVLSMAQISWDNESDYLAGLLHNIGQLVMAIVFPNEFEKLINSSLSSCEAVLEKEEELIEWDHAKIGAYYLWKNHLAADIIEAVQNHHQPRKSLKTPELSSAIQIADALARSGGILGIENQPLESTDRIQKLEGFSILFGMMPDADQNDCLQSLIMSKDRITATIKEMI